MAAVSLVKYRLNLRQEIVPVVLCCAVLLICLIVAHPFADSAFNDDWSYSHVALRLAQTGHFQYNGWGSPTIVFQSLWGALFIRLFGFSFNVLRLASLPFSLGFVALTYLLSRLVGLRRELSLVSAISLAVAPLFLPLAASFMTEPYSCFLSLLCVYAAICSAESEGQRPAVYFLLLLTTAGILGGSNRQTVWAAPVTLIPYLCWVRRRDRRFLLIGAACYAAVFAAMAFVVANFSQKYSPLELSRRKLLLLAYSNGVAAYHLLLSLGMVCILLSLPALLCFSSQWKRIPIRRLLPLLLLALFLFDYLRSGLGTGWGTVPFSGNLLTLRGLLGRWVDGLGYRPVLFGHWVSDCLTYFLLLAITLATYLTLTRCNIRALMTLRPSSAILCLFILSYLPFLVPGALLRLSFDRYVLPVLPVVLILILLPVQAMSLRVPFAVWACLAVFAAYAVVTTHDYYAGLQARAEAAKQAELLGIPADHISAGFERDGWLQLQKTGHIKTSLYDDRLTWEYNNFWFWYYSTVISHEYVAISGRLDRTPKSVVTTVPFQAWMRPFKRAIYVVPWEDIPPEQDE